MRMSRFLFAAVLMLAGFALATTPVAAQQRSLFEALFGNQGQQQEEEAAPAPQQAPQPQPQPQRQPAPAPAAAPAPAPVDTSKAEDALRIAAFGDSLAVDLARALERLYAGDPNTVVLDLGEGSSGFVRDDYFDWNAAIAEAVAEDAFDVAVIMIGINDRQALEGFDPLTERWREAYSARIAEALDVLEAAGKPVIWLELPPMERNGYSADMAQISSLHRMAVFAAGAQWVETYERFSGEGGGYAANGPDLNGTIVVMRKSDGIHFSDAGADKLAFYVDRAMRGVSGGTVRGSTITVADPLAGTPAGALLRPPFQGLGEESQLLAAGTVQQLSEGAARASTLLIAGAIDPSPGFSLADMMAAPPPGRADAFGMARVGEVPEGE